MPLKESNKSFANGSMPNKADSAGYMMVDSGVDLDCRINLHSCPKL